MALENIWTTAKKKSDVQIEQGELPVRFYVMVIGGGGVKRRGSHHKDKAKREDSFTAIKRSWLVETFEDR